MNFIQKIFASKCTVCRRAKRHAIDEQTERRQPCGVETCPFHMDINASIKARELQLVQLSVSMDKVLEGEFFTVFWKTVNCKSLTVVGYGQMTPSGQLTIAAYPGMTAVQLEMTDHFGAMFDAQVEVKAYPPPLVHYFRCDQHEKVASMPVFFEFDYANATRVELFCNGDRLADVTGLKTFTHLAENKTETTQTLGYELVFISQTGAPFKFLLPQQIIVYPQPSIRGIVVSPDSIVLFPKEITISHQAVCCEKVFFSAGINKQEIAANTVMTLKPTENITCLLTPVGQLGFIGEPNMIHIEVCHPIILDAVADKKIALQNTPVTITWSTANHTEIRLQPGNIDVMGLDSYQLRLDKSTEIRIVASNKRDRQEKVLFVDVLSYPRMERITLSELPKLDLNIPSFSDGFRRASLHTYDLANVFIRHLKKVLNGSHLHFNRSMRRKLSDKIKSTTPKRSL